MVGNGAQYPLVSSLYLGTAAEKSNGETNVAVPNLCFPNLSSAAHTIAQQSQQNQFLNVNTVHIHLKVNEFNTVWNNTMDLAQLLLSVSAAQTQATPVSVSVVIINNDNETLITKDQVQLLHSSFLLAGLQCTSEKKELIDNGNGVRAIYSAQPITTISQPSSLKAVSIPISKNNNKMALNGTAAGTTISSMKRSNIVTISLHDAEDADNALIDEDDLLQEEDDMLAPPSMTSYDNISKNTDDCNGRAPCDDCTCGRKDSLQQAQGQVQHQQQPIQTSACGKCGLGDAFRCASCPYLGKPAFKAGEEHLVLLDLQDDL